MKAKLAPAHFNQPMVKGVHLWYLLSVRILIDLLNGANCAMLNQGIANFLSFMNAATDALLYTQNFCTLAEEAGLGICYLGTVIYNPQQIIETLNLPNLVFPIATITLGYPDECPAQPDRLPIEAIVHEERYCDYTSEMIDKLYAYKESLPENIQFIAENNKETLAQVFTDVRYKKNDNEFMSDNFFKALKQQGFIE